MANLMKNLKIGKKLMLIFSIILGLFLVTVVIFIVGLQYSGNQFEDFYTYSYPMSNTTLEVRRSLQAATKALGVTMLSEDETVTQTYIAEAETEMENVRTNLNYLEENYKGEKTNIENAIKMLDNAKVYRLKIQELAAANKNSEAAEIYLGEYTNQIKSMQDLITAMDENTTVQADATYEQAKSMQTIVILAAIIFSLIVLAATIMLAMKLTKSLTEPISELESVAKEMVEGSLSITVKHESEDELGSLAVSMNTLCVNIKEIVADLDHILSGLAEGDFHVTSGCLQRYVGDYEPMLLSMRLIRDNLNATLTQINQSAEQVALGSEQMAQSAQSLAEGATEQAGAVEELTATVEDVSIISSKNADASQEAYEKVHAAEVKASGSQEDLRELTEAMERISDTSKEIENIIASIEDIASQTNLLSLNASIEAARAGDAGKGFAVVADQIGKLAADSARSAINTRELIAKCIEEVEGGNRITAKTVESIKGILISMNEFAQMSKESSATSREQADMLHQVEQGIEQISKVVQNNSAAAEETSATSEELSAQSEGLKQQVDRFQLI